MDHFYREEDSLSPGLEVRTTQRGGATPPRLSILFT
jgi:hypothetical protein